MKKTNCTVHGKPMYRVRAKIGEDLDGRPVMKSFYGDGKVEAERKRDDYLNRYNDTKDIKTFGQLTRYYTYKVMPGEGLSVGTIELYERPYRRFIEPSDLSIRPVADIRPADLQRFLTDLVAKRGAIEPLMKYLRRFFRWSYREGYSQNVMDGVVAPRRPETPKTDDITVFNDKEVQCITRTPNRLHFAFLLALSTGLREGELLALKYSDIQNGSVTVRRQLKDFYQIDQDGYRERVTRVTDPKTKTSTRTVPLPENVLAELDGQKAEHIHEMETNGYLTEYIFTTASGKWLDRGDFRRAWRRHLKRAGVEYKKFHTCRATYCTLLCKRGVPLETASKLMGHSDVSVTASFYRMVSDRELISAAERLNDLFEKPSGDKVATKSKK